MASMGQLCHLPLTKHPAQNRYVENPGAGTPRAGKLPIAASSLGQETREHRLLGIALLCWLAALRHMPLPRAHVASMSQCADHEGMRKTSSPGRRRLWALAAAVAGLGLVVGLVVFKPWLLFVDVRIDEQLPIVASAVAGTPTPPGQVPRATAPGGSADATREPPPPAGPKQLAVGTFISHEHTTTGTVRIIQQPDGARFLTLENLDTSNGPDVHVWLSAAHVVEGTDGWFTAGSAEHYDLGLIKGNQGNQVYEIPAGVDLSKYPSVDLWCVQFSVSFGAAELAS
jgi:hypothetical protein